MQNLERKEKDRPHKERKETTRNEDRLPRRQEAAANARDGLSPVRVKDIQVDTVRRSAKHKEDVEDEPLKKRSMPPPYTKPAANKGSGTSSEDSDSSNDKVEDEDAARGKPTSKSVRTRNTKPSPEVVEKETVKVKEVNKENVAQGRRVLKFLDGGHGGKRDEEEKMMDKLLRHYSRKNGTNKNAKPEPELKLPPNLKNQEGPTRASSLRVESTESPMKHSRAASFHPDMLNANAHVHPKLPDYDEFVARLAAFRGK